MSQTYNEVIYTIGHSNHSIEMFIGMLQAHSIDILADVRSSPNSKYVPHFNQGNLKRELVKAGIQYLFLGKEFIHELHEGHEFGLLTDYTDRTDKGGEYVVAWYRGWDHK